MKPLRNFSSHIQSPNGPPWPTGEEYALAHSCYVCKAEKGQSCRSRSGKTHKRRLDRGAVHYYRDIGKAPWPEEREPGARYDTLDRESATE